MSVVYGMDFFVKSILAHKHSFRLSPGAKATICNWCDTRTEHTKGVEEAEHTEDCPYLIALVTSRAKPKYGEKDLISAPLFHAIQQKLRTGGKCWCPASHLGNPLAQGHTQACKIIAAKLGDE